MATRHEKTEEYHEQFAARIVKALKAGTAPWQKPWPPLSMRSGSPTG